MLLTSCNLQANIVEGGKELDCVKLLNGDGKTLYC